MPIHRLSDSRLIRRSQQGDRDAFAALVQRYDERLRGLAYVLVVGEDAMRRVLRVAYLKAWRDVVRADPDDDAGGWLYRTVYNACIDELRREREVETGSSAGDPVADALSALPPEQRVAVVLVDREGFTLTGAARILGIDEAAVAVRLAPARARLTEAAGRRPRPPSRPGSHGDGAAIPASARARRPARAGSAQDRTPATGPPSSSKPAPAAAGPRRGSSSDSGSTSVSGDAAPAGPRRGSPSGSDSGSGDTAEPRPGAPSGGGDAVPARPEPGSASDPRSGNAGPAGPGRGSSSGGGDAVPARPEPGSSSGSGDAGRARLEPGSSSGSGDAGRARLEPGSSSAPGAAGSPSGSGGRGAPQQHDTTGPPVAAAPGQSVPNGGMDARPALPGVTAAPPPPPHRSSASGAGQAPPPPGSLAR